MQHEMTILWIISFIVTPIVVETSVCVYPDQEKTGVVCDWKNKTWIQKFDLETLEYYYIIDENASSNNFIEKKMIKRYNERVNGS